MERAKDCYSAGLRLEVRRRAAETPGQDAAATAGLMKPLHGLWPAAHSTALSLLHLDLCFTRHFIDIISTQQPHLPPAFAGSQLIRRPFRSAGDSCPAGCFPQPFARPAVAASGERAEYIRSTVNCRRLFGAATLASQTAHPHFGMDVQCDRWRCTTVWQPQSCLKCCNTLRHRDEQLRGAGPATVFVGAVTAAASAPDASCWALQAAGAGAGRTGEAPYRLSRFLCRQAGGAQRRATCGRISAGPGCCRPAAAAAPPPQPAA